MNAVAEYFKNVVTGTWSLVSGMGVTLKYMFRPVTTVQYPRERLPLPGAFRGHIELAPASSQPGHKCVACGECSRLCPSGVIKVQGQKSRASDRNQARFYFIDFSRCSLCGLCVERCPEGALRFSREYEQADGSRYEAVIDLMARLRREGRP